MEVTPALDLRAQIQQELRQRSALPPQQGGWHRLDAPFARQLSDLAHLSLPQLVVAARLLRRNARQAEAPASPVPDDASVIAWAIAQDEPLDDEEIALADELAGVLPLAASSPGRDAAARSAPLEDPDAEAEQRKQLTIPQVSLAHERIFVEFPFDRAKVNAVQPLKELVEDWAFNRYKRQEWSYPQDAAWTVYQAIRGFPFAVSAEARECIRRSFRKEALLAGVQELEDRFRQLSQVAALESVQTYLDGAPVANGQRLFRHQREAVQRMIEAQHGFILAHDMGLGKSRASLIAAQAYNLPIWVIAPAGTLINWQREAEAAGAQITLFSWAKLPEPPDDMDYVLITDEAHFAQAGEETIRGKGFLRLADSARAVFMLSGTPIKNGRPINLWPLLVAARHPLASDRRAYESRYCGGHYRPIGRKKDVYDVSGATNLDELHERTRDVLLYKKKQECLDLPDKIRTRRQAEVSEAGATAYRHTLERLRQAHLARLADKYEALRAGREELLGEGTEESDLSQLAADDAAALVELGIQRHAASLAKVESAVELAQEALEQGQSVLLFCAFRDSAERLATKLAADCLTGEVTGAKRQAMIDRFQAHESTALVATIGAGGIGINLTAAQVVILVDRPWAPGDAEQAEDRAHRIGTRHNVTSIWLQYGAADEKIDPLLELKADRIATILQGRGKQVRGIPSIRALAREILESVTTGTSLADMLGLDPRELEPRAVDLVRDDLAEAAEARGLQTDRRLKGRLPRQRANTMFDPEVLSFLRSIKTSPQQAAKEPGYSGFLEDLVRATPQFAAWRLSTGMPGRQPITTGEEKKAARIRELEEQLEAIRGQIAELEDYNQRLKSLLSIEQENVGGQEKEVARLRDLLDIERRYHDNQPRPFRGWLRKQAQTDLIKRLLSLDRLPLKANRAYYLSLVRTLHGPESDLQEFDDLWRGMLLSES